MRGRSVDFPRLSWLAASAPTAAGVSLAGSVTATDFGRFGLRAAMRIADHDVADAERADEGEREGRDCRQEPSRHRPSP